MSVVLREEVQHDNETMRWKDKWKAGKMKVFGFQNQRKEVKESKENTIDDKKGQNEASASAPTPAPAPAAPAMAGQRYNPYAYNPYATAGANANEYSSVFRAAATAHQDPAGASLDLSVSSLENGTQGQQQQQHQHQPSAMGDEKANRHISAASTATADRAGAGGALVQQAGRTGEV